MVFKKYAIRGGKRYGPYLYENKRVGEKVITVYLGKAKEDSRNYLTLALIAFFVLGLLFLLYQLGISSPTGFISLEIEPSYAEGGQLNGLIKLGLKSGELLPQDSKILVNLAGTEKEFLLSDLISADTTSIASGNFYVEGQSISGTGEGYGVAGVKENYPTITFDLQIRKSHEEVSGEETGGESEGLVQEQPQGEIVEEQAETQESIEETIEEVVEVVAGEQQETQEISQEPEQIQEEQPTEELIITGQFK